MYSQTDVITAQFIEKDLIRVDFVEKEIISARFTTIDVLNYLEKVTVSKLIQEVPYRLSTIRFQTSKSYVIGSLKFYLNGLKEKQSDLIEISSTIFEITEAVMIDDYIEVEYLELL